MEDMDYVAELKIDGLTVALTYEDGVFVREQPEETVFKGEDITANIKTIRSIPLRLQRVVPGRLLVRGEVYMKKEDFEI